MKRCSTSLTIREMQNETTKFNTAHLHEWLTKKVTTNGDKFAENWTTHTLMM